MSSTLLSSYSTGYALGTYVVAAPLIENYAPSLYNAIGSLVTSIVNTLSNSWSSGTSGQAQQSTAPTFQSTGMQMDSFSSFGGDYGAASSWETLSFGGGGGGGGSRYPVAAY